VPFLLAITVDLVTPAITSEMARIRRYLAISRGFGESLYRAVYVS
jgi:hypothetical protein